MKTGIGLLLRLIAVGVCVLILLLGVQTLEARGMTSAVRVCAAPAPVATCVPVPPKATATGASRVSRVDPDPRLVPMKRPGEAAASPTLPPELRITGPRA
jgi:hypothetical protein